MQRNLKNHALFCSLLALGAVASTACGSVGSAEDLAAFEDAEASAAANAALEAERAAYTGAHVDLAAQMEEEARELSVSTAPTKTAYLPNAWGEISEYRYQEVDGMAMAGDMALGTIEEVEEQEKGVVILNKLWPNRTMVYKFDTGVSAATQDKFNKAKDSWTASTGLKFKLRTTETDYVLVKEPSSGCNSRLGKVGSVQNFNLSTDCSEGNARHEIGHAFGLAHEQMRCGRDNDINVLYDNIVDSTEDDNFDELCGASYSTTESIDYGSVMMYSSKMSASFAVDTTKPVMTKKADDSTWTSQRAALSATDIKTIKTLYKKFVNPRAITTIPVRWFANETSPKRQFCKDQGGYTTAEAADKTTTLAAGGRYAEYNTALAKWEVKTQANPVGVYTEINCKY